MKPTSEQTNASSKTPDEIKQELIYEIATITLHPGWASLRRYVEKFRPDLVDIMARRIIGGRVPTEYEVARLLGYREAIEDVLANPVRALEKAKRLADGEPQTEE